MPMRVYSGFLGRVTLESREYAALKTAIGEGNPATDYTVEILCDAGDATLLLKRATESYPESAAVHSVRFGRLHRVICSATHNYATTILDRC